MASTVMPGVGTGKAKLIRASPGGPECGRSARGRSEGGQAGARHQRHQIGMPGQPDGIGKARHDGHDPPRQPGLGQRRIDRPRHRPPARGNHMLAGGIATGGDGAIEQRVARAHGPHHMVAKQQLRAQFRARRGGHANVQIHRPLAQGARVLVRLGGKAQRNARRGGAHRLDQRHQHPVQKSLARAQGEGLFQRGDVERVLGRRQQPLRLTRYLAHVFAQGGGMRRGHQRPPGPHQQRVARRRAQTGQGAAHRGCAQPQAARGARHAALGQQHVERGQQVHVGGGHGPL
jgi:hypothetical protein